jgi:hypothetical protein
VVARRPYFALRDFETLFSRLGMVLDRINQKGN